MKMCCKPRASYKFLNFAVILRRAGCMFLIGLVFLQKGLAEGSKELASNGGSRAYLLSTTVANNSYPFPTVGTMKVYVKAGETIYLGSSAQGVGSGTINLRAPNGQTYTSGKSDAGLIVNRAEEAAGPLPNPGGYTPFTVTAQAGQEGIWEVDFVSPSDGVEMGFNPNPAPVASSWIQYNNRYVTAFDVSVRNAGNTAFINGRVFTNILSGILGTFNVGFNAILHLLTRDGYQYTLNNNGQAGNGFSFFVNNKGFRNINGTASYLSVNTTTAPNVQDPRLADSQSDITHKIFFNPPAADLPARAKTVDGGDTWLAGVPLLPAISNATFTGIAGLQGRAGTDPAGGKITFTASSNGTYVIKLDVNQNGSYNDASDRIFTGIVLAGDNEVTWDGLDATGAKAPVSATPYAINISVSLFAAEVHFPFFDVERNVRGILLTRINGTAAPDNTIYWDDSNISLNGTPSNPLKNLNGISSLVNGHKWGSPGGPNDENDFGNIRSIDTWAYVTSPLLETTVNFRVQEADAGLSEPIPNIITPNGDGKNDVLEIREIVQYPGSRLLVYNRWGNQVYKSEDYKNNWDASGLSDGTYYYILDLKTATGKRISYKGWLYINK